jgi:hypothetical protein
MSRRIATSPAVFIDSNAIEDKIVEGAMDPNENERKPNVTRIAGWTVIGDPNATGTEPIVDTQLIDEIVEWMATEVERRKVLDHDEAAKIILERSGVRAVWGGVVLVAQESNTSNGSIEEVYRFSAPVLHAFRKLTGKTVRWGKDNRYWVAVKPKRTRSA